MLVNDRNGIALDLSLMETLEKEPQFHNDDDDDVCMEEALDAIKRDLDTIYETISTFLLHSMGSNCPIQ